MTKRYVSCNRSGVLHVLVGRPERGVSRYHKAICGINVACHVPMLFTNTEGKFCARCKKKLSETLTG